MKRILSLTILAVAGCASAASIDWATNFGTKNIKDSTGTKLTGIGYLVLTSDLAGIEAAISDDDGSAFTTAAASKALAQTSASNGKFSPTSGTASSSALVAGTSYNYSFIIYDSVNKEYYVSSTLTEVAYDASSEDYGDPTSISFNATALGATAGSTANPNSFKSVIATGPTPPDPVVPEPATGALALAGVALLFKRRRE